MLCMVLEKKYVIYGLEKKYVIYGLEKKFKKYQKKIQNISAK